MQVHHRPRRQRRALWLLSWALAVTLIVLAWPSVTLGHGFERPFPLPVPLMLYLGGAAAAVAASFVLVALVGRQPAAEPRYPQRRAPAWLGIGRYVLAPLGVVWWAAAIAAGLTGGMHDFAPAVLVWVLLWVGVPVACVLVGNPWPVLSPFRSTVAGVEWLLRPLGVRALSGFFAYPAALGRWPAVVFLFLALCFELVVPGSFAGGVVGSALLAYTLLTFVGIALFGPAAWLRNGELFEVLFGWFGRIGPLGRRSISAELCAGCPEECPPARCIDCPDCTATRAGGEQELIVRPWFTGLTEVRAANWSDAAFVVLALAGVSYDGLRETVAWGGIVTVLFNPLEGLVGALNAIIALDGLGLVGMWLLFMVAFGAAAVLTRGLSGSRQPLAGVAGAYAATLLPIAGGYIVAHYFTLLVQGVLWLPGLALDPRSVAPDVAWIPSEAIWYVSVAAIVIGHIAAVVLAHRLAMRDGRRRAVLAGLPLVLLMIGYTIFSLWIIAQPLTVEPRAG